MKEATAECATLPGSRGKARCLVCREGSSWYSACAFLPLPPGQCGKPDEFRELGSNFRGIATRSRPRGQECFTHLSSLPAAVCTFTCTQRSSVHHQGELRPFISSGGRGAGHSPEPPLREEARVWCVALGASLCPPFLFRTDA